VGEIRNRKNFCGTARFNTNEENYWDLGYYYAMGDEPEPLPERLIYPIMWNRMGPGQ
jgi:hypothetical protein